MTLVSVIVPVFNVDQYLRRCIQSVLNQSYSNLEILLINDGSSDSSGEICDEFAKKDGRVSVIHQENRGVSVARNVGLENVRGDWFCFVDSDDEIGRNYISEFMTTLSTFPHADLVIHGIRILDTSTKLEKKVFPRGSLRLFQLSVQNDLLKDIPILCMASPISKLFNTAIIRKNKISFDERVSIGEDYLFVLDYIKSAQTVASDPRSSYIYYRRPSGSLSTTYNSFEEEVLAESLLFEKTVTTFSGLGMADKDIYSFYLSEFKKHAYRILFSLFKNKRINYTAKERIRLVNTLSDTEIRRIRSMFRRNGWKGALLALVFRKNTYGYSDFLLSKFVKNKI